MEWDTPPRTRLFAAAALLTLAAGLSYLQDGDIPSLNNILAGPISPPQGWTAQAEEAGAEAGAYAREELFSTAHQGLRDAVGAGTALQRLAGPAGAPRSGAGSSTPTQDPEETRQGQATAALLEEAAVEVGNDISDGTLGTGKKEALGTARAKGERQNDRSDAGRAKKRARPANSRPARIMSQNTAGEGPEGATPAKAPGRELRLKLQEAARLVSERSAEAKARGKAKRAPRFRPILLSALLGKKAIRPPTGRFGIPDLSGLAKLLPRLGPDGRLLAAEPAEASEVEALRPPDKTLQGCRVPGGHWHSSALGPLYHTGSSWGRPHAGRWAWAARAKEHWWAWTAPEEPTWLEHQGRWWWRSQNVWFLLHEGEPWGYRLFLEGKEEGLIHPGTGTKMVYSSDGLRVAVITPGDGAILFDALTGEEMARWSEEQIRKSKRPAGPSAPASVTLPR